MPHTVTKTVRENRRKQAVARLELYNKLSLQEKLERLPIGGAKKQRARLELALAKELAVKTAPVEVADQTVDKSAKKSKKEGKKQ